MNALLTHNPLQKIWSRAATLAEQTPVSRNRYVDFLRAVSIILVVMGHWLVVAPYVEAGEFVPGEVLSRVQWTQWLTWIFQVIPVFFIVGGFANRMSWLAAKRRQQSYRVWLSTRLRRLVIPLLPLLIVWGVVAAIAHALGISSDLIKVASQFALLPTWFLMVYIMVVLLVPITSKAWTRFGIWSFWGLALGAVLVDVAVFGAGYRAAGWSNYFFIWLAVHQLGYVWQDGHLAGPRKGLLWAIGGLLVLVALVKFGPYPVSMVTVPGEAVSNTLPPNLTMLALGMFQGGLLLSLETPVRRWLANQVWWTITVLVNGMIMTIYLWHITALTLIVGLSLALGGIGLTLEPGSVIWWASRSVWLTILAGVLMLFVFTFTRFEHTRKSSEKTVVSVERLVIGAVLICVGLAFLAFGGVSGYGGLGLRWVLLLPFAGVSVLGFGPLSRLV